MIPEDVWLTNLTATVSPAVQLSSDSGSSSSSELRGPGLDSVQGPSLQIAGLRRRPRGRGQVSRRAQGHRRRHARLGAELRSARSLQRDSRRVGLRRSAEDCATRDFISKFEHRGGLRRGAGRDEHRGHGDRRPRLRADGVGIDGLRGRSEPGRRRAAAARRAEAVDRASRPRRAARTPTPSSRERRRRHEAERADHPPLPGRDRHDRGLLAGRDQSQARRRPQA